MLGMHSWAKVLMNPSNEESGKSSKVFWCTYNSGRLVQKHGASAIAYHYRPLNPHPSGWKRVDIEEHWFQGWSVNNS
jgi:hypothetical protein